MNFLNMLPVLKRGKRTYGISKNTPYTRGRMVIPFCNSFDDTLDFIRESQRNEKYHIYLKRVTGLYVDRIMKQRFQGVNIYERNKLKEVYEKSQERCPELGLFYRNLRQYNGRNLVYDVSKFIDTFYKRTNNKWSLREQLFKEYISPKVFNDQYPDTVIIIPINKGDDYKKGQIIKTNRNEKKIWFAFLTLIKEANDIDELIELFGDTDIVVTSQRGLYKINFKTIKEEMNMTIKDILGQIIRLTRVIVPSSNESVNKTAVADKIDEEDKEELDIEEEEEDSETDKNENNISKRKQEIISKLSDDDDNEEIIEAVEKASEIISEDEDLEDVVKILLEVNDLKMGQVSNISSKERNYLKNTMNVSVNERDFEDILDNIEDLTIEESSFDTTSLDEFNKNSFINFNKTYDKKLKDYDIGNIAQAFSETDIPLYVQDVSIEESSDDLDYKETVKMKFKDAEGKQHNVKVDLPKMIDNKFLYLGGSKKALISQIVPNPITKIDDRVIITTNYNKLFLNYKGGKYLNPNHSILKRAVEKNKDRGVEEIQDGVTFGNLYEENFKEGETTREYNEVSRQIARVKNDDLNISFNLNKMKEDNPDFFEEQEKVNGRYEKILIGQIDGEDVIYDTTDEVISSPDDYEDLTLIDLLLKIFKERDFDIIKEDIESINTVPKTIRHSSLYILGKDTPLILILIYLEGLQYVMDKIDLDYKIIPKDEDTSKPRIDKFNEARLEFKDAYLVYKLDDLASTSLMSYLNKMELEDFSLTDLEDKNKSASILIDESGSHNFPLYIDNYNNLMIDPITRDVLMRFSLPTEFSDVLIYSNYLLSTGENADDKDIKNSRIRSEELITASLYNVLAEQYEDFSAKKKRGSSNAEFSIPKDKVIKEIFDLPNIQEYSTINPIREIDKYSSASFKGLRGINEDRAYTADKRLYDPSFYGKFSPVSSYSGSIGVTKHMAVDPMIKSARGFMENVDLEDVDDLDSKRILTASEALTTDVGNRDDSPRKAMNLSQTSHMVPVEDADPVLYSTGFDESIAHMSDEFTHKAEMDGKITDIEGNYVAVEYEDGSTDVFPLRRVERNSAKGRHSSNTFKLMPDIKVGSKINADDVIAYNDQFFDTDGHTLHFKPGPIVKCALHYAPETYEDATMVNEKLTDRMTTKTVKKYTVKLEADGKIDEAITSFEKVRAGDVLMKFETMLGDDELNEFLNIESSELNKIEKKVKRGGKIIDMKTYRTSNLEDYSSSIQYYIKKIDDYLLKDPASNAKLLEEKGSSKQKILNNKKNSKVKPGSKIGGVNIEDDEVLFEFYVESVDTFSKGDKTTAHTALKFIDARVVPDDKMPVGVKTGDKVDIVISSFSVIKRMTNSVIFSGLMQKALKKLNKDVKDILDL